jgi:hypothetical protein
MDFFVTTCSSTAGVGHSEYVLRASIPNQESFGGPGVAVTLRRFAFGTA